MFLGLGYNYWTRNGNGAGVSMDVRGDAIAYAVDTGSDGIMTAKRTRQ